MKLVRFGEAGRERPGVWMGDGRILDVRAVAFHIEDYNEHFFANHGLEQLRLLLEDPGAKYVGSEGVRLGAPVARPSKIVCVGANYAEHAKEFGHEIPKEPILFSKATTAITGPYDPIMMPTDAEVIDSEAELAVVIGKKASKISASDASEHVAGYMVANDVSNRIVQKSNGQWFLGKGFDTFFPLGPYLVTPDDAGDIGDATVWQRLNGQMLQSASTADMMFKVPFLIEYVSRGMTLLPGDVISTGTPSGIGSGRDPQVLMKPGDVVEIGVDGLGSQHCVVA